MGTRVSSPASPTGHGGVKNEEGRPGGLADFALVPERAALSGCSGPNRRISARATAADRAVSRQLSRESREPQIIRRRGNDSWTSYRRTVPLQLAPGRVSAPYALTSDNSGDSYHAVARDFAASTRQRRCEWETSRCGLGREERQLAFPRRSQKTPSDLPEPLAVLHALDEFDRVGREVFLQCAAVPLCPMRVGCQ